MDPHVGDHRCSGLDASNPTLEHPGRRQLGPLHTEVDQGRVGLRSESTHTFTRFGEVDHHGSLAHALIDLPRPVCESTRVGVPDSKMFW